MDWSHGYNIAQGYTYGYFRELQPAWLDFVALIKGTPPPAAKRRRYLELGCGQGVGLVLMAASNPEMEFVGIDFAPGHIDHAQRLAARAGLANVRFVEGDFVELAQRWPAELGSFDYVVAHGIRSWIPPQVADALDRCMALASHPGTLAYVSYNTLPGWISTLPVQYVLRELQRAQGTSGPQAIERGRDWLRRLIDAQGKTPAALPGMAARLNGMDKQDPAYLVQEYLHDNWHPAWFTQVARALQRHKFDYVGSATVAENWAINFLAPEQRALLEEVSDPILRQALLDLIINQSFRRDLYVRGFHKFWPREQRRSLLQWRFALRKKPRETYEYKLVFCELIGKHETYDPVYQALTAGPQSLAELMQRLGYTEVQLPELMQILALMLHAGDLDHFQPVANAKPVQALNRTIAQAAADGAPYQFLLSAQLGQAVVAQQVELLMLHTLLQRPQLQAEALAAELQQQLERLGRALVKDGQTLQGEAAQAYARELAEQFLSATAKQWKSLGVW